MKRWILLSVVMFNVVVIQAATVEVAAAANLRPVLEELKRTFTQEHPSTTISVRYGSTGTLVQQVIQGAKTDFFMAADVESIELLKVKGLTVGKASTYAFGKLVLYSTTFDMPTLGLKALTNPAVKRIALAQPKTAPYGNRAEAYLKKKGLYTAVKSKLVIGENISQAAQFVFTGNAELGFIALSLAITPEMAAKGSYVLIPPADYAPIEQACVLIKNETPTAEAVAFQAFVLSTRVDSVWERFGYAVPQKK